MMTANQRRTVLLAGAAGGMGKEILTDLAGDCDVVALCRSASQLADFADHPSISIVETDLGDFSAYDGIVAPMARLDILIHAAAIAQRWSVADAGAEPWRRHLEINVIAPALLTRAALPLLRASQGQVVFINSGAGARAVPHHTVYSATKHALHAIADGLRAEEVSSRLRVATVSPGPTLTPMLVEDFERRGEDMEPDRYIDPKTVAKAVRLVVDTTADAQINQVTVRPRREL